MTRVAWSGATAIDEKLGYDLAGNITQINRENGSFRIKYDAVNRLLSSASNGFADYNRLFAYDLVGNRVQDSESGSGSFVNNFLIGDSKSSYRADSDGFGDTVEEVNELGKSEYFYRADGMLSSFQRGSFKTNYFYDALGRRIGKEVLAGEDTFTQAFLHLDKEDRIFLGKSGDGKVTTYVDGVGLDAHVGEVKEGVGKSYVSDHLGSVLNGEAAGANRSFGLFGEVKNAPAVTRTSDPVVYGFTGRQLDAESGLNFHRTRYYSPKNGRWLTQDMIGFKGNDINFYNYASANPQIRTDGQGTFVAAFAVCTAANLLLAAKNLIEFKDLWRQYTFWDSEYLRVAKMLDEEKIICNPVETAKLRSTLADIVNYKNQLLGSAVASGLIDVGIATTVEVICAGLLVIPGA